MKRLTPLFIFLLFTQSVIASDLNYLSPDSIDLTSFPTPPLLNSVQDLLDFETVLNFQRTRSESDCVRAQAEDEGLATSFFGPPYGPLSLEEAKKLVAFQEKLFNEVNFFSRILKQKWKRNRPFVRSTLIQPCVEPYPSNSYPSGHAAASKLAALSFSILYPELKHALLTRADEVARDRVLAGVHYPTDVKSGALLGQLVFEALQENEAFMYELMSLEGSAVKAH